MYSYTHLQGHGNESKTDYISSSILQHLEPFRFHPIARVLLIEPNFARPSLTLTSNYVNPVISTWTYRDKGWFKKHVTLNPLNDKTRQRMQSVMFYRQHNNVYTHEIELTPSLVLFKCFETFFPHAVSLSWYWFCSVWMFGCSDTIRASLQYCQSYSLTFE